MSKNDIKIIFLLVISSLFVSAKTLAANSFAPTTILFINNNTNYPISSVGVVENFDPAPPMTIAQGVTAIENKTSSTDPSEVFYGELAQPNNYCEIVTIKPDTETPCKSAGAGGTGDIQCHITAIQYDAVKKTCSVHLMITGGPSSQKK